MTSILADYLPPFLIYAFSWQVGEEKISIEIPLPLAAVEKIRRKGPEVRL
jgi:hypothetical protein